MRNVVASSLAGILLWAFLTPPACGAQVSPTGGVQLKTVPRRDVAALCLHFTAAPQHVRVSRQRAIQAVENIPVLKRYGKRVAINESLVARVRAAEPVLDSDHDPLWVLVSHQAHNTELYFVDASVDRLVTYMAVGDGCRQ